MSKLFDLQPILEIPFISALLDAQSFEDWACREGARARALLQYLAKLAKKTHLSRLETLVVQN